MTGPTVESLEALKDIDFERLLGRANIYANELETQLFRGIFGGVDTKTMTQSLLDTKLATHQLNVIAYDGLKIFDDLSRYKVFQGQDVKWVYVGPNDTVTRDACQNTLSDSRNSTGFKESEIPSETPFGVRGGFNCRHSWMIKGFE